MSKKNPSFKDNDLRQMVDTHLAQKKNSSAKSPPQSEGSGGGLTDGNDTGEPEQGSPFSIPYRTPKGSIFDEQVMAKEIADRESNPFPVTVGQRPDNPGIGYREPGLYGGANENMDGEYVQPIKKEEQEHLKNLSSIYERINGKSINTPKKEEDAIVGGDGGSSGKIGHFLKNELPLAVTAGIDRIGSMAGSLPSAYIDQAAKQKPAFFEGLGILADWIGTTKKSDPDGNLATNYLEEMINAPAKIQEKINSKASNDLDSEAVGQMVEKAIGLPEEYNPFSPNNGIVKMYTERAQANSELARKNYNGGIQEAIKKGDYATAGKLTSLGIAESLPLMFAMAAGRKLNVSDAATLMAMSAGTTGETYSQLKNENPDIDKNILYLNAVLTGASEGGTELIGFKTIADQGFALFRKGNKEEARKLMREGFKGYLDAAFRKTFSGAAAATEGITEAVNQFDKNVIDKFSGVKPNADLTEGVLDAFIVGLGAGEVMSLPFHAASGVRSLVNKKSIRSLVDQNNSIIPYISSPNVSEATKNKLLQEVSNNTESINNIQDKDAADATKLTTAQSNEIDRINTEIDNKESIAADPDMPTPIRESSKKSIADLEANADSILQEALKRSQDIDKAIKATQVASTPEQVQKVVSTIEENAEAAETPAFQEAVEKASEKIEEIKKIKPKENEDTSIKDNLLKELETSLDALKIKPTAPPVEAIAPVTEPQTTPNEETPIVPTQSPSQAQETPQVSEVPAEKVSKQTAEDVAPERAKYQEVFSKKSNNDAYIRDSSGKISAVKNAKDIDLGIKADFFIHPTLKDGFIITEGSTGLQISKSATEDAAISDAKNKILRITERGTDFEKFYKLINQQLEKLGKTPRYETQPESAAATQKAEAAKPSTKPSETKPPVAAQPKNKRFTAKDLEDVSEGTTFAKKGEKVSNPEKIYSQLKKGDKIKFFADNKEINGVYDGERIRDDKGNQWGLLAIMSDKNGWLEINNESPAADKPKAKIQEIAKESPNVVISSVPKTVTIGKQVNTEIGKNIYGEKLFEDENGVRSKQPKDYPNVYSTEPVSIIPGRGSYVDKANRSDDFQTVEERPKPTLPEKNKSIERVYSENKAISDIGTMEQYSDYLKTIFPESKIKDVLYRLTDNNLESFTPSKETRGIYASADINEVQQYKGRRTAGQSKIYPILMDIKNPIEYQKKYSSSSTVHTNLDDAIKKGNDSLTVTGRDGEINEEVAVVSPDQVHILGSKKDISGFNEYVNGKNEKTKIEKVDTPDWQKLVSKSDLEAYSRGYNVNQIRSIESALEPRERFKNRSKMQDAISSKQLSVDEAIEIIKSAGLTVPDSINSIKEKSKSEKVDDEIHSAFKDFAKSLGKTLNSSGISAETIEKGIKLVGLYAKKGVYQFEAMVGDAYTRFGDQVKDIMDGFKAAYSSYYSQATDDVADQMSDPREVRKFDINTYLNQNNNERGSEPNSVEENAPGVSTGNPAGVPSGNVSNEEVAGVSGTENDGSGEAGNEAEPIGEPVANGSDGGRAGNDTGTERGNTGNTDQADTRRNVQPNTKKRALKPEDQNHKIAPTDTIVPAGEVGKFTANIDAIFLLKKLETENRNPSPEEKKALSQFVGWGGLSRYLTVPYGSDADVVNAYMNGTSAMVYKGNSFARTAVDFSSRGPADLTKFNSANDLITDIRNELAKEGYSITPENIRPSMLKALLTPEEYQSATASTISAHFTDRRVVEGLWSVAEQLGFKGGRVLESSFGIGHFFGLMPESLRDNTSLTAYELDSLTGRMAGKLYPQANVVVDGFENSKVPVNSVDLAITNVPFAAKAPYDRLYPDLSKFSMHNYFIAKNLKMVKPGGLGIFITSSSTMDAPASAKFREWSTTPVGGNSYLVGAIRLPNNAFSENAGTEVTTDVLIFQKKGDNVDDSLSQPFRYVSFLKDGTDKHGDKVPININEYYINNPGQMLGEMMTASEAGAGGLYGNGAAPTLKAPDGFDMTAALNRAISDIPNDILDAKAQVSESREFIDAIDKKEGSLFDKNGKFFTVTDGAAVENKFDAKQAMVAKSYIEMKSGLLDLIKLEQSEVSTEEDIAAVRKKLNEQYDSYVRKYGTINGRGSQFLDDFDIDFPIVSSMETIKRVIEKQNGRDKIVADISKAPILEKRVNFPRIEPTRAADISDAINIALNYKNNLNLDYIGKLLDITADEAKDKLLNNNLAFENPDTGLLETPEEYLSGFVRDKLKNAEIALLNDPSYARNVEELKKVIPQDIPSSLISYSLGSAWIPGSVYEDFAKKIFEGANVEVKYLETAGKFGVSARSYMNAAITNTYGAGGKNGIEILSATLNNKQIEVTQQVKDLEGKVKTVKMPEETAAAQAMQAQMQEDFEGFMREDEAAQILTERIYNDTFNGNVLRNYRIPEFKHYPGASTDIALREHQKRAVSRGLSESTLNAHEVGSGKTFTIITTAMEMRRLGTAKKPMIVVQNSTRGQFISAFKHLYPSANILAPSDKELQADGRRKLFAKIATGDWDAVLLPQSQLSMIPDDPTRQKAYIMEQIEEMRNAIADVNKRDVEFRQMSKQLKDLEKEYEAIDAEEQTSSTKRGGKSQAKKVADASLRIESGISKALDRKTDNIFNFEELGVDALLIDEAHAYKRLGFQTSMKNIKGIDTSKSKRSQSVLLKTRWIQEKTGGKNVLFYTGTPISNTMAEAWTMMKYVRPEILTRMGIEYFDQFAKTFGQVIPSLEQTGGGTFKVQNRFAKFQNLPEFITAFRSATDVVLSDDVKEFQESNTLPKLKGGAISQNIIKQSPELKAQIQEFRKTLEWFDKLSGKEKKENSHIPLVIFNKAKQASIDLRLLDPTNVDSPESKVNIAIRNAVETYKSSTLKKGVQMIFSDMYQSPEPKAEFLDEDETIVNPAYGKERFNLFNDIKKKLIAAGVKENEIAILTEPKYDKQERKEQLFADANSGKLRFLMGTTERMGVGVNAQQKLVRLHHLDAPLRPMDFTQRNGRIIRQGNENEEVEVDAYGVEKTLDSSAFQRLSTKQKFINQVMKGEGLERVTEDPADEAQMTFDEMMAQLSDSPFAMQKLLVDNKIRSERMKQTNFNSKKTQNTYDYRSSKTELAKYKARLIADNENATKVKDTFPDGNITMLRASQIDHTSKFGEAANEYVDMLHERFNQSPTNYAKGLIQINGINVEIEVKGREQMSKVTSTMVVHPETYYTVPELGIVDDWSGKGIEVASGTGTGLLASLRSRLASVEEKPAKTQKTIDNIEKNIEVLEKDANATFDDSKLKALENESEALKEKMLNDNSSDDTDPDDNGGGVPAQSDAEYIMDQSNVAPILNALDKMKAAPGKTYSLIVPIPPALWNGAIEVMKAVVKATNSTQKAIRVAAKYIANNGGSAAQIGEFTQQMNKAYGPESELAKQLATVVNRITENKTNLKARVEDIMSAGTEDYKSVKSKLVNLLQDARKMDLVKQGIAKADNAADAIQKTASIVDSKTAAEAVEATNAFLSNVGYNNSMRYATSAYNRLKDMAMKNKLGITPTVKRLAALNPKVLTVDELSQYLELAPVLVSQLDGKDSGLIADNEIALFLDVVNERQENELKEKLLARYKKLNLTEDMSVAEMRAIIDESKEAVESNKQNMTPEAFSNRENKKREILKNVLDINMDDLKAKKDIPADKAFMVQGLVNINADKLSTGDMLRLNQVVANIVYNDKYMGAGYFAKISQGISQLNKFRETVNRLGGGFRAITFNRFLKDRVKGTNLSSLSLTDKFSHLNTFGEIGKATDEMLAYGIGRGYSKQKDEMKTIMDGLDAIIKKNDLKNDKKAIYKVGVFGELNAYLVGDKRTRQEQFFDNKMLIRQSMDKLENSKNKNEQKVYDLLADIWNEVDGIQNIGEMKDFLSPAEQSVYDYIQSVGQNNFNRLYENNEMYGSKPMGEKANYVHRRYVPLTNKPIDVDIVEDEPIVTSANGVLGQSKTKEDVTIKKNLTGDRYIDYNIYKSFKLGLNSTLNDIHTLGDRIKSNYILNSPDFEKVLSQGNDFGRENVNIIKDSIKQMVNIQRGISKLDLDMYSGTAKFLNFLRQGFYGSGVATVTAAVPQYASSAIFTLTNLKNPSSYLQSLVLFATNKEAAKSLIKEASAGTANRDLQGDSQLEDAMLNFTENTLGTRVNAGIADIMDWINDKFFYSLKAGDRVVSFHTWMAGYIDNLIEQGVIKKASEFTPEMIEQHLLNPNTAAATSAETLVSYSNNDSDSSRKASRFVSKNLSQEIMNDILYPVKKFAVSANNKLWLGIRNVSEWDGGQGDGARQIVGTLASMTLFAVIRDFIINQGFDAIGHTITGALGLGDEEEEERLRLKMTEEQYEKYKADKRMVKFGTDVIGDALLGGQNVVVEKGVKNISNGLWHLFGDEIQSEAKKDKQYLPKNLFYADKGAASMLGVYGNSVGLFVDTSDDRTPFNVAIDTFNENASDDSKARRFLFSVGIPLANQFFIQSADINRVNNRIKKRVEDFDQTTIDILLRDKKNKKYHGGSDKDGPKKLNF